MTGAVAELPLSAQRGERSAFRSAVLGGLARPQKAIPCKFFYDAAGARLFDRICTLPEYYPTRTETAILRDRAAAIARLLPERAVLVEFGSGTSTKVRVLLDALNRPACYVAIDISRDYLVAATDALARDYPNLQVTPVVADFSLPFGMPGEVPAGPRVGFFPGSTIGNFDPPEAARLLSLFARHLGADGALLIGVDLKKEPAILNAAYNDTAGVTAAFNLNLLARVNRELDGRFDLAQFAHHAFYNGAAGRIEMHLVSRRRQMVRIGPRAFPFACHETIHTENSYKYAAAEFQALAVAAGYRPVACWTDPCRLFSVHLLAVERVRRSRLGSRVGR
jgi:L-histidine Nalpha-methyltransferase